MKAEEQAKEFFKCLYDITYFFKNYVLIPVPGLGTTVNLNLYPSQMKYINALKEIWTKKEKDGILLLASRQCGKTVMNEAVIAYLMIFNDNYDVLFMTRDLKQGRETLQEVKDIINRLPDWMRPSYTINKAEEFKLSNGSSLILQASNKTRDINSSKGRGLRPTFIWIDEASFIHLEDHLKAILNAAGYTFKVARENNIPYGVVLSSTPNGRTGKGEKFYKMWMESITDPERSAYIPVKIHWSEIPVYDNAWYEKQKALNNYDEKTMNQEYELLFLGSTDSIFPDDIIKRLQDESLSYPPISTSTMPDGYIYWFEEPDDNKRYIIGIDTATSSGTDYSAVEVINYDTGEQVAEGMFKCQVIKFCDQYIPAIVDRLKNKLLVIESNAVGNQTIEMLKVKYEKYIIRDELSRNKDKYGITMSAVTRPLLMEQIYELFTRHDNLVKSKNLRLQATSLIRKSSGRIEGEPNDDLVFAIGMCFLVTNHLNLTKYFDILDFENSGVDIFDTVNVVGSSNIQINNDDFYVLSDTKSELVKSIAEYNLLKGNKNKSMNNNDEEDDIARYIV